MRRLHRRRDQEPDLTAQPLGAEESVSFAVDGGSDAGARFIHGGARRVRPDRDDREFDLDTAPIAALFDDPEVSDG